MPYYKIQDKIYSDITLQEEAKKQGLEYQAYITLLKDQKGLEKASFGDQMSSLTKNVKNAFSNIRTEASISVDNIQATAANMLKETAPSIGNLIVPGTLDEFINEQHKQIQEKQAGLKETQILRDVRKTVISKKGLGSLEDIPYVLGGFLTGMAKAAPTIIPAMLTRGKSLIPQIVSYQVMDYNVEKANTIYGEDDPDSFKKLLENNDTDIIVPTALGLGAATLERYGYKGMMKYALGQNYRRRALKDLMATGSREAWTEWAQSGIDHSNRSLAQGNGVIKAGIDGINKGMFSAEGVVGLHRRC